MSRGEKERLKVEEKRRAEKERGIGGGKGEDKRRGDKETRKGEGRKGFRGNKGRSL